MSKRSAGARFARHRHVHGAIESAQIRKLDVGAPETATWCLMSLRAQLDGGRLDGSASYATISLRRHVEERVDAAARSRQSEPPRLEPDHTRVHMELTALLGLVARIEDAIAQIIASEGEPGELERAVLLRMVDALAKRLDAVRETEVELSMRGHWLDIGGSG